MSKHSTFCLHTPYLSDNFTTLSGPNQSSARIKESSTRPNPNRVIKRCWKKIVVVKIDVGCCVTYTTIHILIAHIVLQSSMWFNLLLDYQLPLSTI